MRQIKIWNRTPSDRQLDDICKYLSDGEVIIWPTDTLYAFACDALNPKAIEKLCQLKGINPEKTNLSIVCHDISQAAEYARIENTGFQILKANTPGPFTFLLKASSKLPKAFKGRKIVGIRIPDNEISLQIVERLGNPVMTSSINFKDEDYAVNPDLIMEEYDGRVPMMVVDEEGGTVPSTIVDLTQEDPGVLREGLGELF